MSKGYIANREDVVTLSTWMLIFQEPDEGGGRALLGGQTL
jgi:hypothetical protein